MIDRVEALLVFVASLIIMCVLGWLAGNVVDYIKNAALSQQRQKRLKEKYSSKL